MDSVRALLLDQVRAGDLELRQKGQRVTDLDGVKGPLRFAAPDARPVLGERRSG